MKLSQILCASFAALAGFALATDAAFAVDLCMATDRAKACQSRGGVWTLKTPAALPAASCVEPSGAGFLICPCGHCYYPNYVDCVLAGGTWHSAASLPPPFAYCTLPGGGGIQTENPAPTGGSDVTSGSGGIDCYRYGLVFNEIGGCRRSTVCDADPGLEGCGARFRSQFFPFEARSLPDGLYELRMVADDSQNNLLERAKAGKLMTPTILVDNSPPTVVLQADPLQLCTLSARASDKVSVLKSAAYRIDEGVWLSILPLDGVMDDREESFRIILPQLKVGEHLLIVRVEDGAENIGIGRLVIKRCSKYP